MECSQDGKLNVLIKNKIDGKSKNIQGKKARKKPKVN